MRRGLASAELRHFIPEPDLILFGCRPLVPFLPGWHDRLSADQHFHAPAEIVARHKPTDRPWPRDRHCPTCAGMIGKSRCNPHGEPSIPDLDRSTYCGWCDAMSPANESKALAQRLGATATERTETAQREAKRGEDKVRRSLRESGTTLTEVQRRQLWNGYKGGVLKEYDRLTNRAKAGREFLMRINQAPDFDLILDKRGAIVGRWSEREAALLEASAQEFAVPTET